MGFSVYGLLHLDGGESLAPNTSIRDFHQQVELFANDALAFAQSLRAKGIGFTLLTNDLETIRESLHDTGDPLMIREIEFTTDVPSGSLFFSSHFKYDAFRYLSEQDSYGVLCDIDMVCVNAVPRSFTNNVNDGIPMFYDISDQVIPAYGEDVIIRDLECISGVRSEGRWSGGEFIAGPPEFFSSLVREIEVLFGRYVANIETLHHVGDEMTTSAALERMRKRGVYIADAGTLGIVGRFWNTDVLHPQKPLEYFAQCFLLHLPADKWFLARLAARDMGDWSGFMRQYSAHYGRKGGAARGVVRCLKRRTQHSTW